MTYIYIHGFASSGNATKGNILKEFYKDKNVKVLTPDFPDEPALAVKELEDIIAKSEKPVTLFGSSLGGFYAMYLASKLDVKTVLINLAIKPFRDLKNFTGKVTRHKTGKTFIWKKEYIAQLEEMYNNINKENINPGVVTLMLAKDDGLLDYKETLEFLDGKYSKLILEDNSGHEFKNFREILEKYF
jgi:uncharacterized protein